MTGKIMMTDSGCWLIGEKKKEQSGHVTFGSAADYL